MWQSRMNMSRDECRKCLRCLELDAYGNMVSVLRAQGAFTEDKKRLLGELAKVLHISNERHRAEVRRAANDEKLSIIAEQLNGPNTWTDWAIEGRRTIPLLPRLKAHTAFTGLANSLSLVIATANEKKVPFEEKREELIVKAEIESQNEAPQADKVPQLPQAKARGRKRKKAPPNNQQNVKNVKLKSSDMNNHEAEHISISSDLSSEVRTSLSPLPFNPIEVSKSPESSLADRPEVPENIEKSPKSLPNCRALPEKNPEENSPSSQTCQLEITRPPDPSSSPREISAEVPERLAPGEKNLQPQEAPTATRRASTNCDIISTAPSLEKTETICEDNAASRGPGPPQEKLPEIAMKVEKLNELELKKNIKLNPNNRITLRRIKNPLESKNRVIMVRKGVKLAYAGKDLIGKISANRLRLGNKPLVILPRSMPNNNALEKVKVNSNSTPKGSGAPSELRQDQSALINHNEGSEPPDDELINHDEVAEPQDDELINYKNSLVQLREDTCDGNSAPGNNNYSNDSTNELHMHSEKILQDLGVNDPTTEDNEQSNDFSEENCVEETIEITEEAIEEEILIEQEGETVLIDAQTEIFNFESTDENVCEIQIEETVPGSPLTSLDLPLQNCSYEEIDEVDS